MFARTRRYPLLAAAAVAMAALFWAAVLSLRPGPAEAQIMQSVPACQCSSPTSILALSTTVVQCLCGNATCVISQEGTPGKAVNLMQCVR